MPKARFISWANDTWTLSRLAKAYHLPTSTLNHRLERIGETSTGIARALATGVIDCRKAGSIGAKKSYWSYANRVK